MLLSITQDELLGEEIIPSWLRFTLTFNFLKLVLSLSLFFVRASLINLAVSVTRPPMLLL